MLSVMPTNPDLLMQPRYYRQLALALIAELMDSGYQLEDLAADPFGTLEKRSDISVNLEKSLGKTCHVDARYDDRADPPVIHVRESHSQGRNNFSILHELAHHAQAKSDAWTILFYSIQDPGRRSQLKETVANCVASTLLLGDELIEECIGGRQGVTASGIREMYFQSSASMTACLVRSLDVPGERIVLLGTPEGGVYFSADTGTGFRSPSKKQPQPALRDAYDKAVVSSTESARIHGGVGIEYATAASNTNVIFDVALCEGSLLAVVTRGTDVRHSFGDREEYAGSICGHHFEAADATTTCRDCGELRCPECRLCGCDTKKPKMCSDCGLALYPADIQAGRSAHDECW